MYVDRFIRNCGPNKILMLAFSFLVSILFIIAISLAITTTYTFDWLKTEYGFIKIAFIAAIAIFTLLFTIVIVATFCNNEKIRYESYEFGMNNFGMSQMKRDQSQPLRDTEVSSEDKPPDTTAY